jgi:hypothetical protein
MITVQALVQLVLVLLVHLLDRHPVYRPGRMFLSEREDDVRLSR